MKAIIFAGPSLPPAHRLILPGIDWRPPARQGDVYRAALERPAIIGVVDGVFEVVPTVWHKEILWAMTQGIHLYGAASIGALRAAELDAFGMVGIGRVYEAFRDGKLQDDDEVALLHGPEEVGYAPLTEAMVNVRATLEYAVQAGVIEQANATRLARIAKAIYYKQRTWSAIRRNVGLYSLSFWKTLAEQLPDMQVDLKRQDARTMTCAISAQLEAEVQPFVIRYRLATTASWEAACQDVLPPRLPGRCDALNS